MTSTRSQLFLCGFVAQAGFLTLSPILPDVAADFGTSSAAVGQLRTLSGLAGGTVALLLLLASRAPALITILRASLVLMIAGAVVSAIAPTIAVLAGAQVAVGAACGGLLTGGVAAAARWPGEAERRSVLTWTIVGQPAAWVVGMPLVGAVADHSWRLTWLALPAAGAALTLMALRSRPAEPREQATAPKARDRLAGWATSELLATAAWGGTLVYAGALLRESYSISAATAGLILGAGAAGYFPGAFLVKASDGRWRRLVVALCLALAAGVTTFGAIRGSVVFSSALFALLVFGAGSRTTLASSFVLEIAPAARRRASGARAAAMQFGYLVGAFVAGAALAVGGFTAMGLALAALFLASTVPYAVATLGASLDTLVSRLRPTPLSSVSHCSVTTSTPSAARSSSSTAAWARPSSSST